MSARVRGFLGLFAAAAIGLFLLRLWQPERQVRAHSEHLLKAIADKDWAKFATFLSNDYRDQWHQDRATVLERSREVFRYARGVRIRATDATVRLHERAGYWRSRILIDGDDNNEIVAALKRTVNTLPEPFELEWRRMSAKPWDWKLVRAANPELVLPSGY